MGWQADLLRALDAPVTTVSVQALTLWADSEGMPADTYNPLATAEPWPGSTVWNALGVRSYPGVVSGVAATAKALLATTGGYPAIVAALRHTAGLNPIYLAINASTWCRGCQHGHYPSALYAALVPTGSVPPSGGVVTEGGPPAGATGKQVYAHGWGQIQDIANGRAATLHRRLVNAATAAREV